MSSIEDFGFDASLNIPTKDTGTSVVYDGIGDAVASQQIASAGSLELKNLSIAGIQKMVAPGDDLQAALNAINTSGGGTLLMKAGTYTQRTPLVGYSNTLIIGISNDAVIIDFKGSANLSFSGTQVYTTGTVTGVASNVIVSGSGTSWLTKAAAGMQIFLGTRWYKIGSVINDTTLILSEGYGDNLTFPTTYRIANPIVNIILENFTVQNSTGTGLAMIDTRNVVLFNVKAISCNVGMSFTNSSLWDTKNSQVFQSTSDGIQITNMGLATGQGMVVAGNGGNGFTYNNVKTCSFFFCASDANVGDGVNMTTVVGCNISYDASGNGGQGIEMVADCSSNFLNPATLAGNGSDGLKLTSNCDGNIIGPLSATSNGGYGINIASSTDDNNTIVVPYFSGNASGTYIDSGTGTNIVATVVQADKQVFTSSGTWTKPTSAKLVVVTAIGAGGGGGGSSRGGGGGGAIITKNFSVTNITATVAITIGAGSAGTTGNNTTPGGNSSFGTYLTAYGGGGGGNNAGGGGGGTGGVGSTNVGTGGLPATASTTDGVSGQGGGSPTVPNVNGYNAEYGGGGGGPTGDAVSNGPKGGSSLYAAGGGGTGSPAAKIGGAGGASGSYVAGGGGAASSAGADGNEILCGAGGGGGTDTANGGDGGAPGGGGGGGGATGVTTGGTGARGEVRVYSI